MSNKLKDRIDSYVNISNYRLMPKLPIIITVNIRNAAKITHLLEKPYDDRFTETLTATCVRLLQEIDGTVFGYIFNDEIVIIARNDQNIDTSPWLNNYIQKMVSVVSAIATTHFNTYAKSIGLELVNAIFISNVYTVPNITEAINVIISKQQQNFQISIQLACLFELLKKGFNKNDIERLTTNTSVDEKIELLLDETGVNFNDYSLKYRRGIACYRMPQVIKIGEEDVIKDKWALNSELPVFTSDKGFLKDILKV